MTIKPTYEELEQKVKELEKEAFEHKQAEAVLKETELKLKVSERKLKSILRNSPDIIYSLDPKGTITYVNDTVKEYGYSKEDLIGGNLLEFIHPDDREKADHRINERRTGDRSTKSLNIRLLRKDLTYAHLEDKSRGFETFSIDAEGIYCSEKPEMKKFAGTQGIARDISERKRAKEALQESEERYYRALFERSLELVYLCDFEGNFIDANDTALKSLGYTKKDIKSLNFSSLLVEDQLPPAIETAEEILKTGSQKDVVEFKLRRKDGEHIFVESQGVLIYRDGKPFAIQGIARNITERKQAGEALRESEEKYRTILESIEDGYYEIDLGGNFTFFNDSMCKISGYSRDELMGMNNRQYTDEVYAKEIYQAFNKVYTTGKPDKSFHWPVIRKDSTKRTVAASVSLRRDTEGEPIGFQGIVRDITVQKIMQEELLKAKKLESLGVLAGGIAHDFNNLMSAVVGYISLARMKMKPGSKGFKNLIEAEKASIQTRGLTARLITFSEGGEPVKETVPIGDLVKDSVGSSLKSSDINAEFSIPDDISLTKVDKDQMKRAIHNIVTNAQEAMGEQGTINVSCENTDIGVQDTLTLKVGKYVKISIEDQGPGIPDKDLAKIFDPYFSTKEMGTQKGMGLGLAVSDSIVKKHDGLITVKSELGTGTTLYIYLPTSVKEIIEAAPVKKPVTEISVTQGGKILVMDDEEVIRDVCNALLTHLGYEAEVAVEGVEAIEMYEKAMESEEPFDVVFLDLTNKVGMGGADTIVRLLEIDPDVKAIVATGYSGDPIMSNFREHGFRSALPKPFTLDQLKTALQDAIAGE